MISAALLELECHETRPERRPRDFDAIGSLRNRHKTIHGRVQGKAEAFDYFESAFAFRTRNPGACG